MTTFFSYGDVQQNRQGEIFQQLKLPRTSANQDVSELAKALVHEMQKKSKFCNCGKSFAITPNYSHVSDENQLLFRMKTASLNKALRN